MSIKRKNPNYFLAVNGARSPLLLKASRSNREKLYAELMAHDLEILRTILGKKAVGTLLKMGSCYSEVKAAEKRTSKMSILKLLKPAQSTEHNLFEFSVRTETQYEGVLRREIESEIYRVLAKDKREALKSLKAELKSFYPHEYFNTDWRLVKIRVKTIELENVLFGTRSIRSTVFS